MVSPFCWCSVTTSWLDCPSDSAQQSRSMSGMWKLCRKPILRMMTADHNGLSSTERCRTLSLSLKFKSSCHQYVTQITYWKYPECLKYTLRIIAYIYCQNHTGNPGNVWLSTLLFIDVFYTRFYLKRYCYKCIITSVLWGNEEKSVCVCVCACICNMYVRVCKYIRLVATSSDFTTTCSIAIHIPWYLKNINVGNLQVCSFVEFIPKL